jgi:hypothetical protein
MIDSYSRGLIITGAIGACASMRWCRSGICRT